MTDSTVSTVSPAGLESEKGKVTLVYALQAIGFVVGLTFIAGVIVNYIQRNELQGDLAKSHFRWQIRTFWFSLLWVIIGSLLAIVFVGYIVIVANLIWTLYRVIKGWIRLNNNQAMYR
ncbi:hypothetical protein [uncultured Marinobacter sp.]|uniref:DUF4870 family protein n=1 Tax=uncultured Marinobacter sp. TaxID=187379 RepID=UPI0030D8D1D8|tara:strand:- start:266 stop:619 length:354 start_codon:yes stop_codon:yes gene_type:complete